MQPFIISDQAYRSLREQLLRGSLMEWWSVVKGEIEDRTAREMLLMSWRKR